jgi:hypothetical protein
VKDFDIFVCGCVFITLFVFVIFVLTGGYSGLCERAGKHTEKCFYDWDVASECGGYTSLIPITNESGTFYHCEAKNWTVRSC